MDRYSNLAIQSSSQNKTYRFSPVYPEVKLTGDDMYVISTEGDRFDTLAWDFYHNVDFWWIIAAANPEVRTGSLSIPPGIQLRIPAYPDQYNAAYTELNK